MDPIIMKYFLENDDDKEFESLLDNTLASKSLIFNKGDDLIDDYLHNACIDVAINLTNIKPGKSLPAEYDKDLRPDFFDSDCEDDENYVEGILQSRKITRPCPFKQSSKQSCKKVKIDAEKLNTDEFIDSDIDDQEIQRFLKNKKKKCSPLELKEKLDKRMADPFENKSEEEFFSHLRVTRRTFRIILEKLRDSNLFYESYTGGNIPVQAEQALQMFLYYMGQKSTYKVLSRIYSLSESAIMTSVVKCIEGLSRLDDVEIKWPLRNDELQEVEADFRERSGLSGIIGAVGSSCIEMRTNKEPPAGYKIGKLRSIMYLLVVANAKLKFTYIQAGFPGTFSLQEAFESSSIGELMLSSTKSLFIDESNYLIGPKELTLNKHLVIPYESSAGLTDVQTALNNRLVTSNTADDALNMLKSRFATFQNQVYGNLEKIPSIIKACCIVHNIALKDPEDRRFINQYLTTHPKNYSEYRDDSDFIPSLPDQIAISRRDQLAQSLLPLNEPS